MAAWVKDAPISVPLVTQNSDPNAFGMIGEPGTRIIVGAGSSHDHFAYNSMLRWHLGIGSFLDQQGQVGVEIRGFSLPTSSDDYSVSSITTDIPIINIPFFSDASENVLVNRLPNTVDIKQKLTVYGAEANTLFQLRLKQKPLIVLLGIRALHLEERFKLNDAIINIPSVPNSTVNVRDRFITDNHFYGLQVGGKSQFDFSNLTFSAEATLALGKNRQKLNIRGETNLDDVTVIQNFGLFSEPTNLGNHHKNTFAMMPQFGFKLIYKTSTFIRPYIEYRILYLNHVIRPGKSIQRTINLSQNPLIGGAGELVGDVRPLPRFNQTHFWQQGISVGLEFGKAAV